MDTLEYKDLFISESLEHLDELNQALLALEKDPEDQSSLQSIFRTSHTLKGMAATMGFDQITELTHQMENVLDKLRTNQTLVTSGVVDVLFECLDTLGVLIEEISSAESKNIDIRSLMEKLKSLDKGPLPAAPAPLAAPAAPAKTAPAAPPASPSEEGGHNGHWNPEMVDELFAKAAAAGERVLGIRAKVAEGCTFKGVRAFMVHKTSAEHGEVAHCVPDLPGLQEEKFDQEFLLVLLSKTSQDELAKTLRNISEIEFVEVMLLTPDKWDEFMGEVRTETRLAPAPAAAEGGEARSRTATTHAVQSIRVSIERLDNLQNLVGELVINKIRLSQISKQYNLKELKEALTQFDRITDELQDEVTEVRMVPMEHIFNRFPRMIRDLAKERGKEIELLMEGKEIELDRTVLDEINDPLVHLLRNAVDHGIEVPEVRLRHEKPRQGLIRLIATREKNHVIIKVVDDGKGIDPRENRRVAVERGLVSQEEAEKMTDQDAINLIALPGFTTAKTVTEVSGRGVGVDAVRTKIESFGGGLRIESEVGKGSTFILRMPMTLAIIQALLFRLENEIYSIPVVNTVETIEFSENEIKHVQHGEVVMYRDSVLPLVRLQKVLEVPRLNGGESKKAVLVTEVGDLRVGLLVDEVLGQQEIAIKSLGQLLKGIKGFSGVTILGDGRISLVLDVPSLI